ncbi:hypothetical protein Godav_001506 [Gossypium davidsonii]|uniref:Uncharacterized protein n=1 Tax=Gossypium davidsonii TaxID=34287 RepID=A0A7J8T445_GOSDV|nr:hypothetical protein [Gossypium davidsonii]
MRVEMKQIPEEIRKQHKEFREWNLVSSRNDHQTIFKILIDGRHPNAADAEGNVLPTLVYLAREKRPQFHHHFKAGAMNALDSTQMEDHAISARDAFTDEMLFAGRNTTKPMGLKYGCPAEDIITGLSIQCRGWKSIYLNPERESFLGIAPTSLLTMLVQHKRWAEGHFQIFLSRYCSLLYGHNRIPLKLQLAYCAGNLWAANSLPTLYYIVVPCFCLLKDIPLFPKVSSPWVLPFAYVAIAHRAYSLGEFLWCGGTFQAWCNDQRMWLFKRTTSYFFALCDTILKLLGYSNPTFVITAKVADEDVLRRYEQELMEFGDSSPMFVVLASLAMLNLFSCFGAIKKLVFNADHSEVSDRFGLQILLCFLLVALNWPVYNAVFFRKDNGGMPAPVTYKSITFALKLKVEPTSPEAYFQTTLEPVKSYEDMKSRIESITRLGKVPAHRRKEHKGFDEWDFVLSRHHHPSILQILIDGRDLNAIDIEGKALPTLVYLAREKRPHIHHNFKAGTLNALIRVSSRINNAPFILNVDCDMYSNNSKAIRDAHCFFLDEGNGHEIAYVQYPQAFDNLTENEIYGSLRVLMKLDIEFLGYTTFVCHLCPPSSQSCGMCMVGRHSPSYARTFQSARTHCGSKNNVAIDDARMKIFDIFGFQILLCYVLVFINLPIYQGMFFRKDSGKIPAYVTLKSVAIVLLASTLAIY